MKARVGNKIVDVIPDDGMWLDQSDMTYYSAQDLMFDVEPDWSSFRREVAKDILSSLIEKASEVYELESLVKEEWCKQAVEWADELIKQLKVCN